MYELREGSIEAIQHEGGIVGARRVLDWIRERKGSATFLGTFDQEVDYTRVSLVTVVQPDVVNPYAWVIHTHNYFIVFSDTQFLLLFVETS